MRVPFTFSSYQDANGLWWPAPETGSWSVSLVWRHFCCCPTCGYRCEVTDESGTGVGYSILWRASASHVCIA